MSVSAGQFDIYGISDYEYIPDQPEDTEPSLREFLRTEMDIFTQIPFHRVHRLGNYERSNDGPKLIVAKFERAKNSEYVRNKAPKNLKWNYSKCGNSFQKLLKTDENFYYRSWDEHVLKKNLVRDRLNVNGFEYVLPEKATEPQNRAKDYTRGH